MQQAAIHIDRDAIYPLDVASRLTGVSRSALRAAIKKNELQARKRGATWYMSGAAIQCWLLPCGLASAHPKKTETRTAIG